MPLKYPTRAKGRVTSELAPHSMVLFLATVLAIIGYGDDVCGQLWLCRSPGRALAVRLKDDCGSFIAC